MTYRFRLTPGPRVLQLLAKSPPETRPIRRHAIQVSFSATTPAEDLLRRVIDTTPAFLHSSDPDGNLGFFNQRWLEYLGVSEEDLQGWGWTAFIHPEDLAGNADKVACLPWLAEKCSSTKPACAVPTDNISGFCIATFPSGMTKGTS